MLFDLVNITGDEEVAAAQEILDAMAYNEPTKNNAVKILRKMEDILLETANGDEHGFVANILQRLKEKLPQE